MKHIQILSIGNRWKDVNVPKPDDNTLQHVIDVRDLCDPWGTGNFQEKHQDGTDPGVRAWMESTSLVRIEEIMQMPVYSIFSFLHTSNSFNENNF